MFAVPAHAAVSLDGATAFVRATAQIIDKARNRPKEKDAQASLAPGATSVAASVSVTEKDKQGDRAHDHEVVAAAFDSPASGAVEFYGKSTSLVAGAKKTIAQAYGSGSSFDYDFTLTGSYVFNVDYLYAETDDFYSDNYFQLISTSGGPPIFGESPDDGSFAAPNLGSASATLGPGSYEFGAVARLGDLSGVQGPGKDVGFHLEQYEFSLTAVPEPGSWLMMIAGFGVIGLGLRRRVPMIHTGVALPA